MYFGTAGPGDPIWTRGSHSNCSSRSPSAAVTPLAKRAKYSRDAALVEAQRLDVGRGPHPGADPHGLHGPVDDALVERQQVGRDLGDPLGDVEHPSSSSSAGKARLAKPLDRLGAADRSPVSIASIARAARSATGATAMSGGT